MTFPRRVWSIKVRGGSSLEVKCRGNPAQRHDGRLSVWVLNLTQSELGKVVEAARNAGADVSAWNAAMVRPTGKSDVLPTARCPECFWFDPEERACGLVTMAEPVRAEAFRSHVKALEDAVACPLSGSS